MASLAVLLLVLAGNLLAFVVYGYDKHQARVHGDRIPERVLLWLAVFGGLGAFVACELFRHKTRKQPFRSLMLGALVIHVGVALWLLAGGELGALRDLFQS